MHKIMWIQYKILSNKPINHFLVYISYLTKIKGLNIHRYMLKIWLDIYCTHTSQPTYVENLLYVMYCIHIRKCNAQVNTEAWRDASQPVVSNVNKCLGSSKHEVLNSFHIKQMLGTHSENKRKETAAREIDGVSLIIIGGSTLWWSLATVYLWLLVLSGAHWVPCPLDSMSSWYCFPVILPVFSSYPLINRINRLIIEISVWA